MCSNHTGGVGKKPVAERDLARREGFSGGAAGPQLMEALAVDTVAVTHTDEPPPIFAQASGTPVVYLANERLGPVRVAVLVPKHSSLRTVCDLKGKRVAITKSTNSQLIVFEAIDRIGLGLGDIQPVYLSPADGRIAFAPTTSNVVRHA